MGRKKKCVDCILCEWVSAYEGNCEERGRVNLSDEGCDKWDRGRRDKNGFLC